MGDIKNPRWIYLKGVLFLCAGAIAAAMLLMYAPSIRVAVLLAITIWCFCRFYYFAFYVIQHYVDDRFRYAGLIDFLKYFVKNHREKPAK